MLRMQLWPDDFSSPALMERFGRWLATTYDLPQREAIVVGYQG